MENQQRGFKIISGGQTGVDRAALDADLALNIPCGGWCPKDRKGEYGPIPERYPLKDTDSPNYPVRTEMNVRDSDGTLILTRDRPTGGTALTIRLARRHGKPCLVIDLKNPADPLSFRACLGHSYYSEQNTPPPHRAYIQVLIFTR